MEILRDLWPRIYTVERLSNVDLSLTPALLALVLSAWSVRKQLRHDKELAREERDFTQGQRRAGRADEVARPFEAALRRIDQQPDPEDESNDGWWSEPNWPDCPELKAEGRALIELSVATLGNSPQEVQQKLEAETDSVSLEWRLMVIDNEWRALRSIESGDSSYRPPEFEVSSWVQPFGVCAVE